MASLKVLILLAMGVSGARPSEEVSGIQLSACEQAMFLYMQGDDYVVEDNEFTDAFYDMDDDKSGHVTLAEFVEWMPCLEEKEEAAIFEGIDIDDTGVAGAISYKEWMAKFADLDFGPEKDYELEIKEFAGLDVKGYTGPHLQTVSKAHAAPLVMMDPNISPDNTLD
eukprot:TRINITY_DN8906_c0_g2_i2.p1 TRINITY_DN8906_c0_g2~~TRINITY_DN8906_c0_g2_i2.p1  ORF type:complete len:167 (+),score=49.55 TRINITY_DN8906_c0_g2_i2:66-566(+)